MKSPSNLSHGASGICASIASIAPACDESSNAARKFVTEFIDIGGHVVIVVRSGWQRAAQPLEFLQGFGERGERLRRPHGIDRTLRQRAALCVHGFDGGKLVEHRAIEPLDGGAQRRIDLLPSPASVASGGEGLGVGGASVAACAASPSACASNRAARGKAR